MKSETGKDVFFGARKGRNVGKKDTEDDQLGSGMGLRVAHPL